MDSLAENAPGKQGRNVAKASTRRRPRRVEGRKVRTQGDKDNDDN